MKVEQHIMTGSCIIYCTEIVSVLTQKSIHVLFINSGKIVWAMLIQNTKTFTALYVIYFKYVFATKSE